VFRWQAEYFSEHKMSHKFNMYYLLNLINYDRLDEARKICAEVRVLDPEQADYQLIEKLLVYDQKSKPEQIGILEEFVNYLIQPQRYQIEENLRRVMNLFVLKKLPAHVQVDFAFHHKADQIIFPQIKTFLKSPVLFQSILKEYHRLLINYKDLLSKRFA